MDDADLDYAAEVASNAIYFNTGQVCCAGSRLFVHEKIYDRFLQKKIEATRRRKVGNPMEEDTDLGPLVDKDQLAKYTYYIKKGKEEGARLEIGGKRKKGPGYFVEPTIFSGVTDEMEIARNEIFGPVVSIFKFKTIDEVIKRSNSSNYGLASGVITKNVDNALRFTNGLRQGTVWVNCYNAFGTNTPFGGYRNSGLGRELGEYGLNNYSELKTVIIKRPPEASY